MLPRKPETKSAVVKGQEVEVTRGGEESEGNSIMQNLISIFFTRSKPLWYVI